MAMGQAAKRSRFLGLPAAAVVAIAGIAVSGCMGSIAVRSTRLAYNQSYSLTNDQEILLNIVRLRYAESPNFMDLPAITSQIEASSNGNGGSTTTPGLGTWGGLFNLRDAPTLSYTPRTGYNVSSTLFRTLSAETLLDMSPGGNSEIFFLAFVDSINGVSNCPLATSPTGKVLVSNEVYRYGIENFIELQRRGGIGLRLARLEQESPGSTDVAKVTGMDLVNAAAKEYVFRDAGDRVALLRQETVLAAVIQPSELGSPEVAEIVSTFKLQPGRTVYRVMSMEKNEIEFRHLDERPSLAAAVRPAEVVEILPEPNPSVPQFEGREAVAEGGASQDDAEGAHDEDYQAEKEITLNVRSGYQIMSFLSKGVDVPLKHLDSGVAPSFCGPNGRPFDPRQLTRGFFHVRVQKHRPWNTTLAVHYRGHWFYVAEEDAQSRAVVNLLEMILSLQLQEKTEGPVPIN
jgi:hypothetical protein